MRNLVKYIFGCLVIGGITWIILSRIFNGTALPTQNNVAEIVKIDNTPPVISTDKNGNTHATKQAAILSRDQMSLYLHKEIDSLNKVIGIQNGTIIGLTTTNSRIRYELSYRTDSTTKPGEDKRYIIDQQSKWFSAKGVIPSADPIIIEARDSTTIAFVQKGGRVYADVSSANPDMKYYGVRSFIVPEQSRGALGVGLKAVGLFDGKFNYQNTGVSGGLKYMHIGNKWMYDAGAGGVYFNGAGLQPYISFGIYRKLF